MVLAAELELTHRRLNCDFMWPVGFMQVWAAGTGQCRAEVQVGGGQQAAQLQLTHLQFISRLSQLLLATADSQLFLLSWQVSLPPPPPPCPSGSIPFWGLASGDCCRSSAPSPLFPFPNGSPLQPA